MLLMIMCCACRPGSRTRLSRRTCQSPRGLRNTTRRRSTAIPKRTEVTILLFYPCVSVRLLALPVRFCPRFLKAALLLAACGTLGVLSARLSLADALTFRPSPALKNSASMDTSDQKKTRVKLKRFLTRRPTLQAVRDKGYIKGASEHSEQVCDFHCRNDQLT